MYVIVEHNRTHSTASVLDNTAVTRLSPYVLIHLNARRLVLFGHGSCPVKTHYVGANKILGGLELSE